jgi:hypothetical protein
MGFYYCGYCYNLNTDDYCIKEIEGENYTFYYLFSDFDLSYDKRKCFWSNNSSFNEYKFIVDKNKNMNYYMLLCEDFCEICSEDKLGCIKCKNNFYPIDIDYNDYINHKRNSFICYKKQYLNNYYLDPEIYQFIKCEEKCKECELGVDKCSECNYSGGYYKIENVEYNCSKFPPAKNYALDIESKEWRKCNEKCNECSIQSKSELDQQCLSCSDNYYPYKTDYENYLNKSITGFNCYSISEVKKRNFNYFLNSDNQFEKCDISCYECENEKNHCKSCNINFYEIFGHKNRTCFHYPLELYGLIKFEGDILFKRCFKLCKYCSQVTESLFFQQCTDCIDNYTLDLFSFQQSLCIPKDNSNSYFIKKKTKWYIPNFEGIERLEISNNTKIDYELLLNNLE